MECMCFFVFCTTFFIAKIVKWIFFGFRYNGKIDAFCNPNALNLNPDLLFIYCHDYKHLPFSNKPYQPEMNFIENKYSPGLLMSCSGLLHVTNSMTIYYSKLLDSCIKTRITWKIFEDFLGKYKFFFKSLWNINTKK